MYTTIKFTKEQLVSLIGHSAADKLLHGKRVGTFDFQLDGVPVEGGHEINFNMADVKISAVS